MANNAISMDAGGFLVHIQPAQTYRNKQEQRVLEALIAERRKLFRSSKNEGIDSYAVEHPSPEQQDFLDRWQAAGHVAKVVQVPEGYTAHWIDNPGRWKVYKNGTSGRDAVLLKLPW